MLLLGLLLAGAGLVLLLMSQWLRPRLPKDRMRGRGLILAVEPLDKELCRLTVRYTAGAQTHTSSFTCAGKNRYFPGQQVIILYHKASPAVVEQALSFSAAWGQQMLGILLACLLLVAGLVLIRMA